jgi:aminoglycoside phosphotransferase (APT) family kinase protein
MRTVGFALTTANAGDYLAARGLVASATDLVAEELAGGVSASVVAVRGPGTAVVVKQALPRLRVADEWRAKLERTVTEAAAMRLCGELTPRVVPRVLDVDEEEHVMVMELLPPEARNWQTEIEAGRVHEDAGAWAGTTLATWHAGTADRADVVARFDDFEAFEQLRLRPFHETVIERLPDVAGAVAPRLAELRDVRACLVHGDYAKKNMLIAPQGRFVLDFEVAHVGNPVFDLGFFLSFVVLSAIRWPAQAFRLETLGSAFLDGYAAAGGAGVSLDDATITAHCACLVLARTDGTSPAQFLDEESRARARQRGLELLERPEAGLWC